MRFEQTIVTRAQTWHPYVMSMLRDSYDLLLLIGFAVLLPSLLLLPPFLRVPLGLALVLIAPGYALAAALFPRRADFDRVARTAVSLGLSISVLPVLALLLSWLPWGIQPLPIVVMLSVWILLCSNIAWWRRRFLAPADIVYTPPGVAPPAWWCSLSAPARRRCIASALVLGSLLTTGLTTGAIFLFTSDSVAGQTELYILGQEGLAEKYPREVVLGEELTVTMGLVNREPDKASYHVQIWVSDDWNSKQRKLVAKEGPLVLSPGTNKEWKISWPMPWVGNDQKVEFLLFRGSQPEPYRQLWLWVNVIER